MHVGEWEVGYFCVGCDKNHSSDTHVMTKGGVCPYCGHTGKYGALTDVYEKVRRWIRTSPKWMFWTNIGRWEYKDK